MIEIIKAIVFGVVEGITEWLPISSTGHMILVEEFVTFTNTGDGFWDMFIVVVQLGAILAVVLLFWSKIFPFGKKNNAHPLKENGWMSYVKTDIFILWFKILVACVPAAVAGILWDEYFEGLFYNPVSVAIALIVFGIGFIIIENRNNKNGNNKVHNDKGQDRNRPRIESLAQISYQAAVLIGVFQLIAAVFPGTSRSGATILGALLIGVSRTVAAEFTFFLAIPAMAGASLLSIMDFGRSFTGIEIAVLVAGMLSAFLVSMIVIRFLLGYIKKHDFKVFGYYRIVLGIVVLAYFFLVK
ncbi:MAG: undecaprenyl-diphosphate phosphatase [Lachnospiraceae bacterium]|jgi:undecaprenyl-diphosphatase|nr:undecaprenyl-diphosphate phosphatase [Lachnospiraceae bacterium]